MAKNNMCAVLIGVDDYTKYDSSGTHNLPGSVNDVRAWWGVLKALGIDPKNVQVLVSPVPADADSAFHGATVSAATREAILRAITWIGERLKETPERHGLLTYSGHGDHVVETEQRSRDPKPVLALCSAASENGGSPLIFFHEIAKALALDPQTKPENAPITIVLDCCFAGGAPNGAKVLSMRSKALSFRLPPAESPIGVGRVLFAAQADERAYQSLFMGRFHGAFTWALTSALTQWAASYPRYMQELMEEVFHPPQVFYKEISAPKPAYVRLSYHDAMATATCLLRVLGYTQTPGLYPHAAAKLGLFFAGGGMASVTTSPDGNQFGIQLDPSVLPTGYRRYTWLYDSGSDPATAVAYVIVPSDKKSFGVMSYEPGTEYWFMKSAQTPNRLTWIDNEWDRDDPMLHSALSFTDQQSPRFTFAENNPRFTGLFTNPGMSSATQLYLNWQATHDTSGWHVSLTWAAVPVPRPPYFGNRPSGSLCLAQITITPDSMYQYRKTFGM